MFAASSPLAVVVSIVWLVAAAVLAPPPLRALPGQEAGERDGVPEGLRPSPPPSAAALARMERWHRRWRAESAGVRRAAGALASALAPALDPTAELARRVEAPRPALVPACRALARELLALDRDRALPAPEPVVDRYLARGLRRLSGAAMACLGDRPYAAAHELRLARRELAAAAGALRRFGLEP